MINYCNLLLMQHNLNMLLALIVLQDSLSVFLYYRHMHCAFLNSFLKTISSRGSQRYIFRSYLLLWPQLCHCNAQHMQNMLSRHHAKLNLGSQATQATTRQLEHGPSWPLQPSRWGLLTPLVRPDGVELHLPNSLARLHRPGRTQRASSLCYRLHGLLYIRAH